MGVKCAPTLGVRAPLLRLRAPSRCARPPTMRACLPPQAHVPPPLAYAPLCCRSRRHLRCLRPVDLPKVLPWKSTSTLPMPCQPTVLTGGKIFKQIWACNSIFTQTRQIPNGHVRPSVTFLYGKFSPPSVIYDNPAQDNVIFITTKLIEGYKLETSKFCIFFIYPAFVACSILSE
jgi:hypothetical protein